MKLIRQLIFILVSSISIVILYFALKTIPELNGLNIQNIGKIIGNLTGTLLAFSIFTITKELINPVNLPKEIKVDYINQECKYTIPKINNWKCYIEKIMDNVLINNQVLKLIDENSEYEIFKTQKNQDKQIVVSKKHKKRNKEIKSIVEVINDDEKIQIIVHYEDSYFSLSNKNNEMLMKRIYLEIIKGIES
jgi:hypothetical protein